MKFLLISFAVLTMLMSQKLMATPFQSCPSKAFLMQQTVAQLYGVNLVTGQYSLISGDLGTNDKINAVGFNFHDNYIYGWGYEWGTVVRIGSDFQSEPLALTNNPGTNFFVGDVSLDENAYYFYKRGSSFGLYRVSLDESSNDYLEVTRIRDGSSLNMVIYDFAFHPESNFAYSVDRNGQLLRINVTDGSLSQLGNVGETGTFGAVYFDVDGNFYISRNDDGHVFRIDVSAPSPQAVFFAYGPSSSNNDGARCAIAPIVDESEPATTDYGDAPDSYGTSLANNGARHGIGNNFLGTSVDGEYNANIYPGSDDETGTDDEDGLVFITPLIAGLDSLLQVTITGSGYLNIWGDWDQDGQFAAFEKLVSDRYMEEGTYIIRATTPIDALSGYTWTRARLSSSPGIVAYGGVADGEVEDYRVLVTNSGYSQIQHAPYYLAFEDNWPAQGDYDMNDVVIHQQSSLLMTSDNRVKQIEITGEVKALGAGFKNGFAIQLDGISPTNVDDVLVRFEINGVQQERALVELGTEFMVLDITPDLVSHVTLTNGCTYYRTEKGCTNNSKMLFTLKVPFITPIDLGSFPEAPFNPFIYAKPGYYHGEFGGSNIGRGLEIHLKNKMPTSKADLNLFNQGEDASDVNSGLTYQTSTGLPWALAISPGSMEAWQHPLERVDFLKAYPKFKDFVLSEGTSDQNWYEQQNAVNQFIYQN